MKKTFLILAFIASFISSTYAQTEKEVFSASEIVWYGLDFSKAKLIGSEGFANPQDIQNRFFDGWNNLIITEADKYNIKKTFNKKEVINDLDLVSKRNAKVNAEELVINKDYSLDKESINKIIGEYKPEEKSGVGLVFIVESFDKLKEKGTVYVTFFDIASKKVLLTDKLSVKPRGFGVRNFWAGAIHDILEQAQDNYKRLAKKQ